MAQGEGAAIWGGMTPRHRLIRTLLLATFTAAAIGRAELGADTEASVLFTPAFAAAVPAALLAGWLSAPWFGTQGLAGWLRAVLAACLALLATGLTAPLLLPLLGGVRTGLTDLLAALPFHPLAWGSALAGAVAVQVVASRQGRPAATR